MIFCSDGYGTFWFSEYQNGFVFFKNYQRNLVKLYDGPEIPGPSITGIGIDPNNSVWIGSENGYARLPEQGNSFLNYMFMYKNCFVANCTYSFAFEKNYVWAGQALYSFARSSYDDKWIIPAADNNSLPMQTVHSICIDKFNTKWMGYVGNDFGLLKYIDENNWTLYDSKNSGLPPYGIMDIKIDKNNMIWILSIGGGLVKFDGTTWQIFNTSNSPIFTDNNNNAIAVDNENSLWIGNCIGLQKFDGASWKSYTDATYIYAMVIDKYNNKWLGTLNGLYKFDGTNWTLFTKDNSPLPDNSIYALAVDNKQRIWIGTPLGLAMYDQDGTVNVDNNETLPNDYYISQNYPNPFNPTTTISYSILQLTYVTLKVYDSLGREIATLVNSEKNPGKYEVNFDGSKLSSGVYFYRITAGSFTQTKKLILLK